MAVPRHSLLFVKFHHEISFPHLMEWLEKGIKVIIFSNDILAPSEFYKFEQAKLLQIYKIDEQAVLRHQHLDIVDGELSVGQEEQLKSIAKLCKEFNIEQYCVEHAPLDKHLYVKAGAGTGKTTVMIQRILYIVHKTDVSLSELVLITFTKEAAQRMFQKLREEFYKRFKATSAVKYLSYIEELKSMRISTIHSFARQLVTDLGSKMGYGSNVKIRSFKTERKMIIEKHINRLAESWMEGDGVLKHFNGMPLYKVVSIADAFWKEMEQKGLSKQEIEDLVWGTAPVAYESLHGIFSSIFNQCEEELQQLKIDSNAVTLSDLTRQLDFITRDQETFHNNPHRIKFLFIDEFQDTDDIQIKLAARLVYALGLKLFVVGDIKQSIYRFRGARYTAFRILEEQLQAIGEQVKDYSLTTNYRSTIPLLEKMDRFFSVWGAQQNLPYGEKDRLSGIKPSDDQEPLRVETVNFERFSPFHEEFTVKLIQEARSSLPKPSENKLAVLVRTNNQALYIQSWCERAGINVQLDIGGTFFTSPAVHDFNSLMEGLLFPNKPDALLNLMNSPYSDTELDWTVLPQFDGNEAAISSYIHSLNPLGNWNGYLMQLRIEPVLLVIRSIIDRTTPTARIYQRELAVLNEERPGDPENEQEAHVKAKQYQLNLNHLFELIHRQYSSEFLSLYSLHSWIKLQMATNRDEDEPMLDEKDQGNRVRVMTVHKAKGLEFHTVLIPFTDKVFRYAQNELLLDGTGDNWKAGWFIRNGEDKYYSDSHQALQHIEEDESIKEETRLLYVAMTRAENRLWIISNRQYYYQKNWSMLLSMQEVNSRA